MCSSQMLLSEVFLTAAAAAPWFFQPHLASFGARSVGLRHRNSHAFCQDFQCNVQFVSLVMGFFWWWVIFRNLFCKKSTYLLKGKYYILWIEQWMALDSLSKRVKIWISKSIFYLKNDLNLCDVFWKKE